MKKKIFAVVCLFSMIFANSVFAAAPINGVLLERGVDRICYYVDSTANLFLDEIIVGVRKWTNSGYSPSGFITMIPVSSTSATDIDMYGKPETFFRSRTVLGEVKYYTEDEAQFPEYPPYPQYCYFARVYLNRDIIDDWPTIEWEATVAHELGHCFGLTDNNDESDHIMCQTHVGRTSYNVHVEEYNKVVSLYD